MTSKKLVAVLLLSASAFVGVVNSICPDEEDIKPCYCREESGETVLRCVNIPEISILERVAQKSDGFRYDQMHIEGSTLQYIPKIVLETIRMRYCALRSLTLNRVVDSIPNTLDELKNLQLMNVKALNGVSWEVFNNTSGLETLTVNEVPIPIIKEEFNTYVTHNLKTLNLQYTGATDIAKGAFQDFDKLETLSLIYNELKSLRRDSFPTTCNIEILFLQSNKITDIPDDLFENMPKLRAVYLNENLISRINEPAFGALQSANVDLSENPIKCDCYLKWFVSRSAKTIQAVCSSPKRLTGKSLRDITLNDLDC